jgi:hypothetical protein
LKKPIKPKMGNQALEARERLNDVKIGLSDTSNDCPPESEGFYSIRFLTASAEAKPAIFKGL